MILEKIMEINPFQDKNNSTEPEKETKKKYEKDEMVENILEKYNRIKKEHISMNRLFNQILKVPQPVLKPSQIDLFLQKIIKNMNKGEEKVTGGLISKLMRKSYENGHTDFVLNTGDTEIYYLGENLIATPERPAKITINGNAGYSLGAKSHNCRFIVKGNSAETMGDLSKKCYFKVEGNMESFFASGAEDGVFEINGNVWNGFMGNFSERCKFKSSRISTYLRMCSKVSSVDSRGEPSKNEIIYTGRNAKFLSPGNMR